MSIEHSPARASAVPGKHRGAAGLRLPESQRLWTTQQTADFFNVPPQTLRMARSTGVGVFADLPFIKLGDGVRAPIRYDPEVCRSLAARRTVEVAA